jgi:hypothetical protein
VPVEAGAARYWMPVDQYIGGVERHLHLLFALLFAPCEDPSLIGMIFASLFTRLGA